MTREEQIKCFGETIESMESILNRGHFFNVRDVQMYVMGIISDAQHMVEAGQYETARQFMNKAKWYLGHV